MAVAARAALGVREDGEGLRRRLRAGADLAIGGAEPTTHAIMMRPNTSSGVFQELLKRPASNALHT